MSTTPAEHLRVFHAAFDLYSADRPSLPPQWIAELRQRILEEEVGELASAVAERNLAKIAHELADVAYVLYGTALTYGADLDAVLAEVHRANMTKLDAAGRPVRREDGKVVKSDRYRPPDVAAVLERAAQPN